MEEIKTPALASEAKAQGSDANNVLSLARVKAFSKNKFLVVRQPVKAWVANNPFFLSSPKTAVKLRAGPTGPRRYSGFLSINLDVEIWNDY